MEFKIELFDIKYFGELRHCIVLKFNCSNGKVIPKQKSYIVDLLGCFGMLEAKPNATPLELETRHIHL